MPVLNYDGRRVLFIHIPKTGGTTISRWMEDLGPVDFLEPGGSDGFRVTPQHFTLNDHLTLHPEGDWDYVFTVVRNPYDRLRSEYQWRTQVQEDSGAHRTHFSRWTENHLRNYLRNHPTFMDNHIRPQSDFIDSSVEVFRYEDGLGQICDHVAGVLGVEGPKEPLPRSYASQGEIQDALSAQAIVMVNRIYDLDFEWFGYKRVGPTVPKVVDLNR